HPGIGLTAQDRAGRGGDAAQLRDDRVLADQITEDPRTGGRVASHSTIAGKLPVLSSVAGGTGSGSRSRIRSWIWPLSSAGAWVASSTRYLPGFACAWARNPSLTRSWKSAGSASRRSADTERRPS